MAYGSVDSTQPVQSGNPYAPGTGMGLDSDAQSALTAAQSGVASARLSGSLPSSTPDISTNAADPAALNAATAQVTDILSGLMQNQAPNASGGQPSGGQGQQSSSGSVASPPSNVLAGKDGAIQRFSQYLAN